jgi:glycosyltransferase involved in cell wall biosynthesis
MQIWMIDPAGNTPYYDAELTTALEQSGVDITLLTSRYLYTDLPIEITQYSENFFFKPLSRFRQRLRKSNKVRQIARLLIYPIDLMRFTWRFRQSRPDLLHIQWMFLPVLDRHLFRLFGRRTPLIVTVHNPAIREARFASISDMSPYFEFASKLIVHSQNNADMLVNRFPQYREKVEIIPIGTMDYQPQRLDKQQARTRLQLPANARIVLFFGLIRPYKGLITLIEAMEDVVRQLPAAHLLIAGKSHEDFAIYQQAIEQYGLNNHVTSRIDFIPDDEVPAYFSAADVLCLPYKETSQSAVLLNAFGFGMPVVVTNVGGLPDMVEAEQNGTIVPPNDPQAMARALVELLSDEAKLQRYSQYSLYLAREKYSWQAVATQTAELYQRVLEQK